MRVGVLGINHKLANLNLRELVARACQRRFALGGSTEGETALILLTTCNRTEIYFSSKDLVNTHQFLLQIFREELENGSDQKVYSFFGPDCFHHLARVTAGLDSAIIGETEIQGQVKSAYESALSSFAFPSDIHFLFQNALKIGKKVRTAFNLERGFPDLQHALFQLGELLFPASQEVKILFVGASNVNAKIIQHFKTKNIKNMTLTNRSFVSAELMANEHQVQVLSWDQKEQWLEYDWIIFGTKSLQYLLSHEELESIDKRKVIFDLSVPRNVDPKIKNHPLVNLFNIDQINQFLKKRKQLIQQTLEHAEDLVANESKKNTERFQVKTTTLLATS